MLISNLERRMPKYRYGRFANVCDVIKLLPVKVNAEAETFLDILLDSASLKCLETYQPGIKNSFFKQLLTTTKKRIEGCGTPMYYNHLNLSLCSLWLNKNKPASAIETSKSPLSGKIYASVSVRHSLEDKSLFVQELETCIGHTMPMLAARATVAFPPVREGEVWTVGWIQGVAKADAIFQSKNGRNQYMTLVCVKLVYLTK